MEYVCQAAIAHEPHYTIVLKLWCMIKNNNSLKTFLTEILAGSRWLSFPFLMWHNSHHEAGYGEKWWGWSVSQSKWHISSRYLQLQLHGNKIIAVLNFTQNKHVTTDRWREVDKMKARGTLSIFYALYNKTSCMKIGCEIKISVGDKRNGWMSEYANVWMLANLVYFDTVSRSRWWYDECD